MTDRPQLVTVQFEIDGQAAGWTTVLITRGAAAQQQLVTAEPVLKALAPRLPEELKARLAAAVENRGFLPLGAFEEAGVSARYDQARLLIELGIPAEHRRVVVADLGARAEPQLPVVPQSTFSGFFNVRVAEDFNWVSGQSGAVRLPFRVALETAVNLHGWVLEGRGELSEAPGQLWTMGDVRLVRDDTAHAVRFVAGDLTTPHSSFLHALPLLGLALARNFSLDPSLQVLPEESIDFVLERSSTVQVLANGRPVRTMQLAAGAHDLRGLILEGGANELELVITDDLGIQRRVIRRVGLASGQLAPGVFEAAAAIGIPLQPLAAGRSYDWSRPTLSASYRRGLSSALSLGGSLQADPISQAADIEQLWSTWYGSLAARGALSHFRQRIGYAGGLRYELQRTLLGQQPSVFGVGVEYRSADFTLPGDPPGFPRPSYVLNASGAQGLSHGFFVRAVAQLRADQGAAGPRLQATASVSKGFANGLALAFDLSGAHTNGLPAELRARLNLVWTWPEVRRSAQAVTELDERGRARARLTVNQELNVRDSALRASASVAQDADARATFETVGYRGQRAEASVSHHLSAPLSGSAGLSNTVQLRLGTSLVFAGGVFAWSRPVTGGFAIVTTAAALKGQSVVVNPTSRGSAAAVDALGPAVLVDLQPYVRTQLTLQAPQLRLGTSLGEGSYSLLPGYRRGALVQVGEEGSVFVRGTLSHLDGSPIALGAGTLQSLSDPRVAAVPFFTNRTGRFVITGLTPGTFALQMDEPGASMQVVIPAEAEGIFELGQLHFEPARVQDPGPHSKF